mmetsp:Transcript_10744/g.25415  ORF Transcript_10744/g.25415 Transcript_10744/m.25415 type:complete len:268 (-) Transcript_10744:513-1316(-)
MGRQGIRKGPHQHRAHRGLAGVLQPVGEGLVLAAGRDHHLRGVGHPLHPLDALALGVGDIVEVRVLLQLGVGLGDGSRLLLPQVRELFLEDVHRLVGLQRLLYAHADVGQEGGQLVHLGIAQIRPALEKVTGRVLRGLVHWTEPSRLTRGGSRLLHSLDPHLKLPLGRRKVVVLLRSAVLVIFTRIAELRGLAELAPGPCDHHLQQGPAVLHCERSNLLVGVFCCLRLPLEALLWHVSHHNVHVRLILNGSLFTSGRLWAILLLELI